MRNEEPTVRPWERHWNRVTHGETVRVERSVFMHYALSLLYIPKYMFLYISRNLCDVFNDEYTLLLSKRSMVGAKDV